MNNRRKLIIALGASAAAAPTLLFAQRVYRIAVLNHGSERTMGSRIEMLRAGLKELGYVEGKNLNLSVRWNEGGLERLPDLAAELLRDKPDVVVAGNVLAAQAVFRHTRTVPIVLAGGAGAVKVNLAQSLARPGGNVTGVTNMGEDLVSKQVELLKTMVPGLTRLGILTTGKSLVHDEQMDGVAKAAQALKLKTIEVRVAAPGDLARLAANCGKGACQALFVEQDPNLTNWRAQIIDSAARLRLPAIYYSAEFVQEGGLMSYSANGAEMYRRAATYVDKILKGAKPGDLPIEQPTTFDLVVNRKTAKALGLKIPNSILVLATKIIE
jgi:putative ABC transport system substrate-binding protein